MTRPLPPFACVALQVDEGLKSLESCMACGFDNFEQIRKDKNLAALRKSPKFNVSTCTRIAPCIGDGLQLVPSRHRVGGRGVLGVMARGTGKVMVCAHMPLPGSCR